MMNVLQRAMPDVYRSFQPLRKAIGTPDEQRVLEAVYHELRPINFSSAKYLFKGKNLGTIERQDLFALQSADQRRRLLAHVVQTLIFLPADRSRQQVEVTPVVV